MAKNVLTPLAKIVLKPSGLAAAASRVGADIHKKYRSGTHESNIFSFGTTTLIISSVEMGHIIKIVISRSLVFKMLVKQLKMKQKTKKVCFMIF